MKKIILILLLLCFLPISANAWNPMVVAGGKKATTDYTADANCMGAWFMAGDGVDDEAEPDQTTAGTEDLDESADDEVVVTADRPTGYSGSCRDFEESETEALTHADGGNTDISGADQPISIVAWVKMEADGTAVIAGKYKAAASNRQYRLEYDSTQNAVQFYIKDVAEDTSGTAIGATDIYEDAWHHVAAVYDDTDIRIYIDGSLDSNGASNPLEFSAGIFAGEAPFAIGAYGDNSTGWWDGVIDEVAVFNRALSDDEVADIYANGLDGSKGAND